MTDLSSDARRGGAALADGSVIGVSGQDVAGEQPDNQGLTAAEKRKAERAQRKAERDALDEEYRDLWAWNRIEKTLFGIFVAFLSVVMIAAGVTHVQGGRWFAVKTASMGTYAPVGALVVTEKVAADRDLAVGEVITFHHPRQPQLVFTHRIYEITDKGYVTKGDNSPDPDGWVVSNSNIIGVVKHHWYVLGFVLVGLPYFLIGLAFTALFARYGVRRLWRRQTYVVGVCLSYTITAWIIRPFLNAQLLGFDRKDGGVEATLVSTGIFPIRAQAIGGSSADLNAGEVGTVFTDEFARNGSFQIIPEANLTFWWWVVVVLFCLAPTFYVMLVGFPYFIKQSDAYTWVKERQSHEPGTHNFSELADEEDEEDDGVLAGEGCADASGPETGLAEGTDEVGVGEERAVTAGAPIPGLAFADESQTDGAETYNKSDIANSEDNLNDVARATSGPEVVGRAAVPAAPILPTQPEEAYGAAALEELLASPQRREERAQDDDVLGGNALAEALSASTDTPPGEAPATDVGEPKNPTRGLGDAPDDARQPAAGPVVIAEAFQGDEPGETVDSSETAAICETGESAPGIDLTSWFSTQLTTSELSDALPSSDTAVQAKSAGFAIPSQRRPEKPVAPAEVDQPSETAPQIQESGSAVETFFTFEGAE